MKNILKKISLSVLVAAISMQNSKAVIGIDLLITASGPFSETMVSTVLSPFISSSHSFQSADPQDVKKIENLRQKLIQCEMLESNFANCAVLKNIQESAQAKKIPIPTDSKNFALLVALTVHASQSLVYYPSEKQGLLSSEDIIKIGNLASTNYHDLVSNNVISDAVASKVIDAKALPYSVFTKSLAQSLFLNTLSLQ